MNESDGSWSEVSVEAGVSDGGRGGNGERELRWGDWLVEGVGTYIHVS